jgi:dihydroxy-acid dehydratase
VIHPVSKPFKRTGGLRLLRGNLAPDGGAVLKVAGIEGGLTNGVFRGRARVFKSEGSLIEALSERPETFQDGDMVVLRYQGPRGAPGMPELLDPTSRVTALCRQRNIVIALMTDARFSGGSVGLVIGHVAPEALLGGPIALVEEGDTVIVDLNADRLDSPQLDDSATSARRASAWQAAVNANGGIHPDAVPVTHRVLSRMRTTALPARLGGGMGSV